LALPQFNRGPQATTSSGGNDLDRHCREQQPEQAAQDFQPGLADPVAETPSPEGLSRIRETLFEDGRLKFLQPRNSLVRQTCWRAATDDDEHHVYAMAI
jgi:hypothetical protein